MKTTTSKIKSMKGKEKISMLTAYDYSTAKIEDESGVNIILVGDSLGMVVLGYENTLKVTMDDMLRHTGAVSRGAKNCLVVGDMPVNTYNDNETALKNAKLFLEAGADKVVIKSSEASEVIEQVIDLLQAK